MARPAIARPTDGELDILRVLWGNDGSSAAEIRAGLKGSGAPSASSIGTRLKIMEAKNLVRSERSRRPKRFFPIVSRDTVQRQVLLDLARRLFDGSELEMVIDLVSNKGSSPETLGAIASHLMNVGQPGDV